MIVCAHGDVSKYCKAHDMIIGETYNGEIEDYNGHCGVIVTDCEMSEAEYYFLKGKMLGRRIELVSVHHKDNKLLSDFIKYQAERRKQNYGGRQPFGYKKRNGEPFLTEEGFIVASRILEMRDKGYTLRQIREDKNVHHPDGRRISVSTIQLIIKNRKLYEL